MKRVSYMCSNCKYSTTESNLVCEMCTNGDKFVGASQRIRYDCPDELELKYIDTDIASTRDMAKKLLNTTYGACRMGSFSEKITYAFVPPIKKVIFNDPATIVIWADDTKTVVKASNESFDPEKGLAMAISKKVLGNKGNYFNEFKKWIPKVEDEPKEVNLKVAEPTDESFKSRPRIESPWYIWMRYYDLAGNEIGEGVHPTPYKYKGSATRRAKQLFGDNPQVKWAVGKTNPWED